MAVGCSKTTHKEGVFWHGKQFRDIKNYSYVKCREIKNDFWRLNSVQIDWAADFVQAWFVTMPVKVHPQTVVIKSVQSRQSSCIFVSHLGHHRINPARLNFNWLGPEKTKTTLKFVLVESLIYVWSNPRCWRAYSIMTFRRPWSYILW